MDLTNGLKIKSQNNQDEHDPTNTHALPQAVKAALRTHSFQIVRMQNEVQGLKKQLSQASEDAQDQRDAMKSLYNEIAELKGLVARLMMETHLSPTKKAQVHEQPEEGNTKEVSEKNTQVEKLVDSFLTQQRELLMLCLDGIKNDTADKKVAQRRLSEPIAGDQSSTPGRRSQLDARAKEFTLRSPIATPSPLMRIKAEE